MNNIWLAHHGILGQKWGVRRFQNKDGSLTAAGRMRYSTKENGGLKRRDPDNDDPSDKYSSVGYEGKDYILNKNTNFYRITRTPNEKFKDRMYASRYEYNPQYMGIGMDYMASYKLSRDTIVAGKQTIEQILKELGKNPIDRWSEKSEKSENDIVFGRSSSDFYMNNKELAESFTKKLKEKGYDALMDPVDSNIGIGYDPTAIIFVQDVLEKIGEEKFE